MADEVMAGENGGEVMPSESKIDEVAAQFLKVSDLSGHMTDEDVAQLKEQIAGWLEEGIIG